jgi:hypothetical protein
MNPEFNGMKSEQGIDLLKTAPAGRAGAAQALRCFRLPA